MSDASPDERLARAEQHHPVHLDAMYIWSHALQVPFPSPCWNRLFDIAKRVDEREEKIRDLEKRLAKAEANVARYEKSTEDILNMLTFGEIP